VLRARALQAQFEGAAGSHQSAVARYNAIAAAHAAAIAESQAARDRLREILCQWVRDLRHAGAPPEAMLVEVKSVVRAGSSPGASTRDLQALLDEVVPWCIDAYYANA
jgi:hypothetical protein